MQSYIKKSLWVAGGVGIGAGLCASLVAFAWTGPTASAPANNATAPLNVSNTGQIKQGGLELGAGFPNPTALTGLIVHGNVGIGNISPSAALDVKGDIVTDSQGYLRSRYSGTTDNYRSSLGWNSVQLGNNGANYIIGGNTATGGSLYFVVNNSNEYKQSANTPNGTTAMVINSLGQVVMGSTVPYAGSATLTLENPNTAAWTEIVNYNNGAPKGQYGIYVYGTTYALYANGPVYGSAFYYTSDARQKKNIQTIASSTALQKVLALEPVTFNWIASDKPTTTQIGFIAQQVKTVAPELVLTDASTTLMGVDYARVTPLLVGGMQAQQAQIEAQQKEIDDLKAEVEALKASR